MIRGVLDLLLLMVNFGYYAKPEDIVDLMKPLRKFVNGRNDRQNIDIKAKEDRLVKFEEGLSDGKGRRDSKAGRIQTMSKKPKHMEAFTDDEVCC